MCVAAVIESNHGPKLAELRQMEDENPHGAGIAYAQGNRIRYVKGLTADMIFKMQSSLPRPYLLHFRWATHGPKVQHLCHPFPLGMSALMSRRTSGTADAVLIHNGVWTNYERHLPVWAYGRRHELSDTAVAAYVAESNEDILDDVSWATAVGRAAGAGRMDVTLRGSTWEVHKGDLYSNLRWQSSGYKPPRRYSNPRIFGAWDRSSHETISVQDVIARDFLANERKQSRQQVIDYIDRRAGAFELDTSGATESEPITGNDSIRDWYEEFKLANEACEDVIARGKR